MKLRINSKSARQTFIAFTAATLLPLMGFAKRGSSPEPAKFPDGFWSQLISLNGNPPEK